MPAPEFRLDASVGYLDASPACRRSRPALSSYTFAQQDKFFDAIHYGVVGPYIFRVLILFHAGAAVWHHVVQKDDILKRVLPGACQA